MSTSTLKNFNLEKNHPHICDNIEFSNHVSLQCLEELGTGLKQLKQLEVDLGPWLNESANQQLNMVVTRLEKAVTNVRTTNINLALKDILDFAEAASLYYEQKVEIEIASSNLRLDFEQYSQLIALLEFIVMWVLEKLPKNTANIKFTVSFIAALDQISMDVSSNISSVDFSLDIEKQITEFAEGFICKPIANEGKLLNLLLQTTRKPYNNNLLLVEIAESQFAINQENIIGVVRSEIIQNNFILFKGENVPLISLKKFLNLPGQENQNKRLNFASIFNDEQVREDFQSVVLFNIDNYKCGLIVDNIIENGEFLVYPSHKILAKFGYYMGVIEQKNQGLLLVIDPAALMNIYNQNKGVAPQGVSNNSQNISEMISYLLAFEEKIEKISNQPHLEANSVLVLEDSPLFRKLIVKKLEDEANSVFAFDDSALALEYLKQNPKLNIIIADFNMPDLDGLLFAQKAKAIRSSINVISLISAIEAAEIKSRKLDDLFYAFVARTDQEKITKMVNSILINEIEYNR